jgi:NADH-ubiquinone oxidoreductase chain 2
LVSSLLSLIIGSVLGLTQVRIKRLLAYTTISHVGFILLALSINSIESIQAFIFYLMQYTITNLNAFIILISIGFSLFYYENKTDEYKQLTEKENSPIQLISQLKGYFYINPVLALSLAITIFSFVGIPPLIGFFAKQMVLSAALDSGYVFMALLAILTSVISAVYYLNIIKQVFFDKPEYKINSEIQNLNLEGNIIKTTLLITKFTFKVDSIKLSTALTNTISILTMTIVLFILMPDETLSMANILALLLFNP